MVDVRAVRRACLALPEATERETWGSATFRVRDKVFVIASKAGMTFKPDPAERDALLGDPRFTVASYVGRFGWVSVGLADVGRDELVELVTDSWRQIAPKRLTR